MQTSHYFIAELVFFTLFLTILVRYWLQKKIPPRKLIIQTNLPATLVKTKLDRLIGASDYQTFSKDKLAKFHGSVNPSGFEIRLQIKGQRGTSYTVAKGKISTCDEKCNLKGTIQVANTSAIGIATWIAILLTPSIDALFQWQIESFIIFIVFGIGLTLIIITIVHLRIKIEIGGADFLERSIQSQLESAQTASSKTTHA